MTAEELFDLCIPEPNTGCFLWLGAAKGDGYGGVYFDGRHHLAHRAAYELSGGVILDGLELDHLCRVRSCVNPASGSAVNARKTSCVRGHPFDDANTRATKYKHGRRCRACDRERWRRRAGRAA